MRCAKLGVPVYNDARAIERSVDKSMTSLLLHAARIPTPPTWATESLAEAQRIVMRESAAGHALVLKPLFGSQGKGLQRVGLVDGAHRPLPALEAGLAYLQRFIEPVSTPGFDWRVLVIGGRAVSAMRRISEHWIHNVAQGARCEAAALTPELASLAEARVAGARHGLRRCRPADAVGARAADPGDRGQRCRGLAGPAARQRLQHRARAGRRSLRAQGSPRARAVVRRA